MSAKFKLKIIVTKLRGDKSVVQILEQEGFEAGFLWKDGNYTISSKTSPDVLGEELYLRGYYSNLDYKPIITSHDYATDILIPMLTAFVESHSEKELEIGKSYNFFAKLQDDDDELSVLYGEYLGVDAKDKYYIFKETFEDSRDEMLHVLKAITARKLDMQVKAKKGYQDCIVITLNEK